MARSFYDLYKRAEGGEVQKVLSEITQERDLLMKASHKIKSRYQKLATLQQIDTLDVWANLIKEDFLEVQKSG